MCQYRPRYHLMYDPQCREILLTGKQYTARRPSFSTFSSKSSPRRDNSLSFECSLWNEKGETENTQSINPVRAEKRERLAEAGLFFFLLVKHNIYCPFCSTNAKPDVRVLRWLTRVSSGSVELLSDGKRIGALTFVLLFRLPCFSSRTKSYAGCVLAT